MYMQEADMLIDTKLEAINYHSILPCGIASQARPLPAFSMLHAEKREGLVREVTCVTYPHRETLIASGRAKGHQVSECSRLQQVGGKALKLQTECSTIL